MPATSRSEASGLGFGDRGTAIEPGRGDEALLEDAAPEGACGPN